MAENAPCPGGAAQAPPPGRWAALTRSFRRRNFRLFFAGQFVSLTGAWMQNVAEAWLVYRLTGSSAALGLVRFAALAPVFALALVGGDWADRADRRSILLLTQSAAMLLAFALAALCLTGAVQVWHIMVLATLLGVVSALDVPTRQSFLSDLVDKADLANAIGLNSSMFHLARVVGPTAAGVVLAAVGEGWCFLLNGLSFLAVLASLAAMRIPPRTAAPDRPPFLSRLREGLGYAWRTREVRNVLALVATGSLFGSSYLVLMPVFASEVLHAGAGGFGLLMTAAGAGSLAGALVLSLRRDAAGLWRVRSRAALVFGASLACFALSDSYWVSAALLVPVGFGMILFMAASNTLLQTLAPDALRGRIMALFSMMFMGMAPFGALLAGFLAESLGAQWTVGLCGAACLACSLALGRTPAGR
ncbi:MAG: MFS transporter [Thermodesulfobacteriota bacterium]